MSNKLLLCGRQLATLTNMLRVFTASFHLGLVVRVGKLLFLASKLWAGPVGCEVKLRMLSHLVSIYRNWPEAHLRAIMGCLEHNGAISKLLHKAVLPLDG